LVKRRRITIKSQDFIEDFYNQDFQNYKDQLFSQLKKNDFKLYRYVPVHQFLCGNNEIKQNLLSNKQFGVDSLLNKFIFHNKPSFFNDPYDCVFGISTNAFFRELLRQFTEIKVVGEVMQKLQNNPHIFNLDEARNELNQYEIAPNIKHFIEFVFDLSEEVITKQETFDINKGMISFSRKLMENPEMYIDLLKPFISQEIDKEKLTNEMKKMQARIGEENVTNIKVDPSNIRINDFKEMSRFAGIAPGFQQAEDKINDSVGNFNDKIFSFIDDRFGIASLTTRYNDALMWSHYASSHTGICIEYDFKDYIEQLDKTRMLLFPVSYSDKRVTIDQTILDRIDLKNIEEHGRKDLLRLFFEGLYTKNTVWKYEDEWRSITLLNDKEDYDSRKIKINNISAIYFGNKMNAQTKKTMLAFLEQDDKLSKVKVYEMINDISEYRLNGLLIK
jgi:hypothetical protein